MGVLCFSRLWARCPCWEGERFEIRRAAQKRIASGRMRRFANLLAIAYELQSRKRNDEKEDAVARNWQIPELHPDRNNRTGDEESNQLLNFLSFLFICFVVLRLAVMAKYGRCKSGKDATKVAGKVPASFEVFAIFRNLSS